MLKITPLEIDYKDALGKIYPTVIEDDKDLILVDTGVPNSFNLIEKAMIDKNINLSKLTKIIITHQDYDHMGSVLAFKQKFPNIEIIASEIETPYIEGKEKFIRSQNPSTSNDYQFNVENIKVNKTVKNKDILPYCGGIEVIETPGHLPGHISLYLKEQKTLIAGDAVIVKDGKLSEHFPQYVWDLEESRRSIAKLFLLNIDRIICYHGGELKGNINDQLGKLIVNF